MPDLTAGSTVNALDTPPTVFAQDITTISNLSNTTYSELTPEVGVTFVAPTTGRVTISIGGSLRNNAANSDRVALAPQVYLGSNSSGTEVLAPSVFRGVCTDGIPTAGDYCTYGHTTLLTGLTPGSTYYARVMAIKFGSAGSTVDIAMRDIHVAPAT